MCYIYVIYFIPVICAYNGYYFILLLGGIFQSKTANFSIWGVVKPQVSSLPDLQRFNFGVIVGTEASILYLLFIGIQATSLSLFIYFQSL